MAYADTHGRYCALEIPASFFDATLTDFPVLFTIANLPSEMFDADGSYPAKSDGSDVRFSSDSGGTTPLNCEIVVFSIDNDPANGTAEIWVKVPSCSSSVATTIYVWYNDPDASAVTASDADEGSQGVWDSSFEGVYHMPASANNDASGYPDSTANANHMTGTSMALSPATGPWGSGYAATFDGSADLINTTTVPITAYPCSLSAWANPDNVTADMTIGGEFYTFNSARHFRLLSAGAQTGDPARSVMSRGAVSTANTGTMTAAWHYVGGAHAASNDHEVYFDGTKGTTETTDVATFPATSDRVTVGAFELLSTTEWFAGDIDEFRLSSSARSDAWFKAEYLSGNSPGDVTVGSPTSPGGGGAVVPPHLFSGVAA